VDPGSTPLLATVNSWSNNPYGKVKLVPPSGEVVSIGHKISTEKIYGSKMVYFDDNFASSTSNVPVNNWFWAVAVITGTSPATNQVCLVEVDIEMDVEFYSRKALIN
jgi:hypothetical protein